MTIDDRVRKVIIIVIISALGISGVVTGALGAILNEVCEWQSGQPEVSDEGYREHQETTKAVTCLVADVVSSKS